MIAVLLMTSVRCYVVSGDADPMNYLLASKVARSSPAQARSDAFVTRVLHPAATWRLKGQELLPAFALLQHQSEVEGLYYILRKEEVGVSLDRIECSVGQHRCMAARISE